jgi:hypothetical protein
LSTFCHFAPPARIPFPRALLPKLAPESYPAICQNHHVRHVLVVEVVPVKQLRPCLHNLKLDDSEEQRGQYE